MAASRTTNAVVLVLVLVVVLVVATERRDPQAPAVLRVFLVLGALALSLRLSMALVFGTPTQGRIELYRLPTLPLPEWAGVLRLGRAVTLEGLLGVASDALRMATILLCVGAANVLATPARLLRHLPATLYDVGTALVVGLTYAPQLARDAAAVQQARQLRGHSGRGVREVGAMVVPVLSGALERSVDLAASMEARGYGRLGQQTPRQRAVASTLALVGLLGILIGCYGLLDGTTPVVIGLPALITGVLLAAASLAVGSRQDARTTYRPDRWGGAETLVVACGLVPAAVALCAGPLGLTGLTPDLVPLEAPPVPVALVAALAVASVPAALGRRPRAIPRPPTPEEAAA